jgi:hypothetical protein
MAMHGDRQTGNVRFSRKKAGRAHIANTALNVPKTYCANNLDGEPPPSLGRSLAYAQLHALRILLARVGSVEDEAPPLLAQRRRLLITSERGENRTCFRTDTALRQRSSVKSARKWSRSQQHGH